MYREHRNGVRLSLSEIIDQTQFDETCIVQINPALNKDPRHKDLNMHLSIFIANMVVSLFEFCIFHHPHPYPCTHAQLFIDRKFE